MEAALSKCGKIMVRWLEADIMDWWVDGWILSEYNTVICLQNFSAKYSQQTPYSLHSELNYEMSLWVQSQIYIAH